MPTVGQKSLNDLEVALRQNRWLEEVLERFDEIGLPDTWLVTLESVMNYNFVRIHQTLRVAPAMAAGVTPKLWSLTDMVRVIEDWEIARSLKISGETMVG